MLNSNTLTPKVNKSISNVLVIFVIYFSTKGSDLANNPIASLSISLLFIFYTYYVGIKFPKTFYYLISSLWLYFTLLFIKFNEFTPLFYSRVFSIFVLGYIALFLTKDRFIPIYIKIVTYLSFVSVVFYILGIYSYSTLFSIGDFLSNSLLLKSELSSQIEYRNLLIYTIRPFEERFRNSGFMWEPGSFSVVIGLALYLNLALSKFKLNRTAIILFITLLTTQSTTGYVILMLNTLFYLINKKVNIKMYLTPLLILCGIYLWQLDFMGKKIQELSSDPDEKLEIFYDSKSNTGAQSLGRFAGLIYNLEGVKLSPIFGIGSHEEVLYSRSQIYLYSTNGIGQFLMTFGYLGLFFFLITMYVACKNLSAYYSYKGGWTLFIVLLVGGFSFLVFMSPIFCTILFFSSVFKNVEFSS